MAKNKKRKLVTSESRSAVDAFARAYTSAGSYDQTAYQKYITKKYGPGAVCHPGGEEFAARYSAGNSSGGWGSAEAAAAANARAWETKKQNEAAQPGQRGIGSDARYGSTPAQTQNQSPQQSQSPQTPQEAQAGSSGSPRSAPFRNAEVDPGSGRENRVGARIGSDVAPGAGGGGYPAHMNASGQTIPSGPSFQNQGPFRNAQIDARQPMWQQPYSPAASVTPRPVPTYSVGNQQYGPPIPASPSYTSAGYGGGGQDAGRGLPRTANPYINSIGGVIGQYDGARASVPPPSPLSPVRSGAPIVGRSPAQQVPGVGMGGSVTSGGGAGYGPQGPRNPVGFEASSDRQLMDYVSRHEGTDPSTTRGYNEVFGKGKYGYPDKPLTSMTIREVADWSHNVLNPATGKYNTSATGRYQFISGTLLDRAKELGYNPDTTLYSAPVQDKLFLQNFKVQGPGAWASLNTKQKKEEARKMFRGVNAPPVIAGVPAIMPQAVNPAVNPTLPPNLMNARAQYNGSAGRSSVGQSYASGGGGGIFGGLGLGGGRGYGGANIGSGVGGAINPNK